MLEGADADLDQTKAQLPDIGLTSRIGWTCSAIYVEMDDGLDSPSEPVRIYLQSGDDHVLAGLGGRHEQFTGAPAPPSRWFRCGQSSR